MNDDLLNLVRSNKIFDSDELEILCDYENKFVSNMRDLLVNADIHKEYNNFSIALTLYRYNFIIKDIDSVDMPIVSDLCYRLQKIKDIRDDSVEGTLMNWVRYDGNELCDDLESIYEAHSYCESDDDLTIYDILGSIKHYTLLKLRIYLCDKELI